MEQNERRLNYEELAERLNCKPCTIRKWTLEGCPTIRVGRVARYYESQVVAWLEQRAQRKAQERKAQEKNAA